jgi:hypothetical protein
MGVEETAARKVRILLATDDAAQHAAAREYCLNNHIQLYYCATREAERELRSPFYDAAFVTTNALNHSAIYSATRAAEKQGIPYLRIDVRSGGSSVAPSEVFSDVKTFGVDFLHTPGAWQYLSGMLFSHFEPHELCKLTDSRYFVRDMQRRLPTKPVVSQEYRLRGSALEESLTSTFHKAA